jgi:predicted GH43/DUF377 family glycosyl hydrolase
LHIEPFLVDKRLLKLSRYEKNPIIASRQGQDWEAGGTFNPGAAIDGGKIHLLYRAVDTNRISRLGYACTVNGTEMDYRCSDPVLMPSAEWEEFGCEDPRIVKFEGTYYVTYTAYSWRGPRIALASTDDFKSYEKYGLIGPDRNDKDCVIFPERIAGKIAMIHRLKSRVQIAYFDDLESLVDSKNFWNGYVKHLDDHEVFHSIFSWERRKVGVGPPPIKTDLGWLVIYHGVSIESIYRAGAILLDLDNPSKVLARTKEPILEPEMEFEKYGVVPNVVFPDGAIAKDGELLVYYGGADKVCCVASAPLDEFLDELKKLQGYSS